MIVFAIMTLLMLIVANLCRRACEMSVPIAVQYYCGTERENIVTHIHFIICRDCRCVERSRTLLCVRLFLEKYTKNIKEGPNMYVEEPGLGFQLG
jgi:hypothetical protein